MTLQRNAPHRQARRPARRGRMLRRLALLTLATSGVLALGASGAGAYNFTLLFAYVNSPQGVVLAPWASGGPMDVTAPITAGPWTVVVEDTGGLDPAPSFSLTGPGVDFTTDLGGGTEQTATFNVTLQPESTYTFQDTSGTVQTLAGETGPATASTSFQTSNITVGDLEAAASPPEAPATNAYATGSAAAPKPTATPARRSLQLTIARGGTLSLTSAGKTVSTLVAGHYSLSIHGGSALRLLQLKEVGGATISIAASTLKGDRSQTVSLVAGSWTITTGAKTRLHLLVEPAWS